MNQLVKNLHGTGVALVTPFNKNQSIDFDGLYKLVNHVIKGKCEYLVVLGTTGENVTLGFDEKQQVVKAVVDACKNRVPVVMGLGGNNTNEIIADFKKFDFTGISAFLSVSPYYNKPSQEGIYQHYSMIAKESPLPIILYNVPGRTGSNMLPQTTLRLARDYANIIGIKEASGNVEQVMTIIANKPDNFLVISGDDSITLPLIAAGANGLISVVANAYPKVYSDMVRFALKSDFTKARKLHYSLIDLIPLLFEEGNPAGIKYVLNQMKVCKEYLRPPLAPISAGLKTKLNAFLDK